MRGREIELPATRSWHPCCAIIRWGIRGRLMAAAVRPSHPYRDWARGNAAPISRKTAATHLDRQSGNARTRRFPHGPNYSPSRAADASAANTVVIPHFPHREERPGMPSPRPHRKIIQDTGCQVDRPGRMDKSGSPDVCHLEVSPVLYRAGSSFQPPWPRRRCDVLGRFGAIRGARWIAHTPPEIDAPENQSPPERTHEVDGRPRFRTIPCYMLPLRADPPRFRPPSPPFDAVPPPPDDDPQYIPVPPGTRAVYTTAAMTLRRQPEMIRPARRSPPI